METKNKKDVITPIVSKGSPHSNCIVCGVDAVWQKEITEKEGTHTEYFCDTHIDFKDSNLEEE